MIKLLIIADDFTGAMDTGVQLAKKGVKTWVALADQREEAWKKEGIEVLSLDAETRHLPREEAYTIVRALAEQALREGIPCIYKKTDSTLRGNVGAELDALLDVSDEKELIFLPAFPKGGRITVDGMQYVNGIPLAQSVFAEDPLEPVRHSCVKEILREQCQKPVRLVQKMEYEAGTAIKAQEKTIVVYDAAEEADLQKIVPGLKKHGKTALLAGCAGFAEYLPELLELKTASLCEERIRSGILLVCGSVNPRALAQIEAAKELGYEPVTLNLDQKLGRTKADEAKRSILAGELAERLEQGGKMILRTLEEREELSLTEEYAKEHGIAKEQIFGRISDSIGEIVDKTLRLHAVSGLVVFGGDTLLAILRHLKCEGVVPKTEIAPGVVAARVIGLAKPFPLVTKAGGLGEVKVIEKIDAYLSKAR